MVALARAAGRVVAGRLDPGHLREMQDLTLRIVCSALFRIEER